MGGARKRCLINTVFSGKPEGTKLLGRPHRKWQDILKFI
jgi:hypothetical protein